MAEINIPVKLQIQNLQALINELQNKLSNLKVGSTGFKAIQNTITAIRGEIDKLSIQTAKPFVDASQFTKAERSVEKLEDDIEKVGLVMSRLKFSDLELTPQQKADIKSFEDQLTSIKDKLKVVKNTAKDEFLNSAMGKEWLKIDETAFSKSLSQITNNIRRAVADQSTELGKLEQTALSYQRALSENERIKSFISENKGDPLSEANLGDLYDKIFMTTAKGQFRYTNNGRNLLADWLEQQLHLDDSVITQIVNKNVSAANVAGKLKEVLNNQMQQNKAVVDNNPNITAQVDQATAKYQNLIAILKQVGLSEQEVANAETALRAAFSSTTSDFNAYKDKLVQVAQGNTDVRTTTGMMKSQLESLRTTLDQTNGQFIQMQRTQQSFNQMKIAVVNFMGFNQVLRLTRNAIRNAINHIKELDTVMNKISIVTNMSTADLWNQVDAYSKMAQTYGVSIKGAYEVSQIYYQQGLATNDVLTLTNETLKLAKISGLDYATTTDYMTTAIRGFKMEMSEASRVVDVYSNLAAHTAVSQEELAVAMSKTASSMEAVGATFEEASAMIGTMVAVTRESATNIGSAMKSIASRYGELTKDPTKLVDEDGEAMAFNKVDAALQSVGISMRTVDGQFREFTDVIVELGEKWDELDSTQQRYIATQFAGNRQQSRFLALVSNVDLLKSNLDVAMNSEDTGTLQALKALDSIESKTEQVRVAYQQFYTTIGAESVWKGFLDGAKNVINTLNSFPKLFGKLPVAAIAAVASIVTVIKNLGVRAISGIAEIFGNGLLQGMQSASNQAREGAEGLFGTIINTIKSKLGIAKQTGTEVSQAVTQGVKEGTEQSKNLITPENLTGQNKITYMSNKANIDSYQSAVKNMAVTETADVAEAYQMLAFNMQRTGQISTEVWKKIEKDPARAKEILDEYFTGLEKTNAELLKVGNTAVQSGGKLKQFFTKHASQIGSGLQSFGSALHMVSMMIDTTKEGGKTLSGTIMSISGAATLAGIAIKAFSGTLNSIPWMAIVSGAFALINGISTLIVTPEERLAELEEKVEDLNNKAKKAKAEYRTFDTSIKKLNELEEKRYDSVEAAEEYQEAVEDLAEQFPSLIAGFDEAGNIILDTTDAERLLADAREKSQEATYAAAKAELKLAEEQRKQAGEKVNDAVGELRRVTPEQNTTPQDFSSRRQYFVNQQYDINGRIKDQDTLNTNFSTILNQAYYENREITDKELIDGLFELNEALSQYGNQVYNFMDEFTGSTVEELYTYMQNYRKTHKEEELTDEFKEVESLIAPEIASSITDAYQQAVDEIYTLSSMDASDPEFKAQLTKTNAAIEAYRNLVGEDSPEFTRFDQQIAALETINSEAKDYANMNDLYKGNARAVVSAWQRSSEANSKAWDVLSESSAAAAFVTNQIVNDIGSQDFETVSKNTEYVKRWRVWQENMATWLSSLSPEELEEFNRMASDTSNYSAEDIISHFRISDDTIIKLITDYYDSGISSIQDRLITSLAKSMGKNKLADGTYEDITEEDFKNNDKFYNDFNSNIKKTQTTQQEKYLSQILKSHENLINNGYTTRAQQYGTIALELFNSIIEADADTEKYIWSLIEEHGLDTLEGIQYIKSEVQNNLSLQPYLDLDLLDQLEQNIIPNINLAIQAATSELLDTWEDTSKDLTAALSGGVSLKEADSLIQKAKSLGVNLSLNDFQLEGDKLVLVGTAFDEYYAALTKANEEASTVWLNRINDGKKIFETYENGNTWLYTDDERALLQSLGFDITNTDYYQNGHLTNEGIVALGKAISQNQEDLENYNRAAQIAADQLLNSHERSQGIYKVKGVEQTFEQLEEIASSLTLGKDEIEKRAIKEALNEVYGDILSDVFSKGFENINFEDYEGISDAERQVLKELQADKDYVQLAQRYAKIAGKTIDETNDLIVEAYEKEREQFSEDLIKDLTFTSNNTFLADRDALLSLANAFDIPIEKLIETGAIAFNEITQQYTLDINKLAAAGIDLRAVDNFELTLQECLDSLFNSISSDIKKSLSGSLDAKGVQTLKDNLNALGINTEKLNFMRTKDGYKLSTKNVEALYDELVKIDAITAQLMLDELNSSIDESVTGVKSLRKEIEELRATTESVDFKFMDRDIPSGQQNPLNYWSNWSEAFKIMQETTSNNNYMDYEDFYNIITEMGNLAAASNQTFQLGKDFEINATNAAELIERGASALTMAADGTVKVDLSQLGIDFSAGATDLRSDIGAGMREIAKSQVELLDGMIKFMETVVALEDLGKIDDNQDGIIDFEELLKHDEIRQSIVDAADANKKFKEQLESIIIDDMSLYDVLKLDAENLTESQATAINAIWQAYESGDYDLNNLVGYIRELFGNENITIDFDADGKINLHVNTDVEVEPEINNPEEMQTQFTNSLITGAQGALSTLINEPHTFSTKQELTGEVNTLNIVKGDAFQIIGDEAIWDELTTERQIEFIAYIFGMDVTKEGNWIPSGQESVWDELPLERKKEFIAKITGMTVTSEGNWEPTGDSAIWQSLSLEQRKQFITLITGMTVDKDGNWVPTGDKAIWDELSTEEQETFIMSIIGLEVEKDGNWQPEGIEDIWKLVDTTKDNVDFILSVAKLITKWQNPESSHEPDYINDLGLKEEYVAPEATVIQKVKLNWEFEGEEEALNRRATEIYAALSASDWSMQVDQNNNHIFELDNSKEADDLRALINQYITLGGTRYQINDQGYVVEITANFDTKPLEEGQEAIEDTTNNIIELENELENLDNYSATPTINLNDNATEKLNNFLTSLNSVNATGLTTTLKNAKKERSYGNAQPQMPANQATGNVALAQGTLMGELGPELVVSNGRYFVAGQNGAEFVDLDPDAIVFNHLQTQSLLNRGMSNGRGKALTSEKRSVAYATGNINGGPAMASARQALAALKQLRAQWQAIVDMDIKSLANLGGSGGKGGGGGGSDASDPKAFTKELEKWYNWLQRIAVLEQKITYEEQKRSKIQSDMYAHGQDYAKSHMETLDYLRESAVVSKSLYDSQQEYFNQRRAEMNSASNPFSALYTFDEYGQLKYQNGAFAQLAGLSGRNALTGQGNYTAADQYAKLVALGFEKYMQYDSSGNKIDTSSEDWEVTAVQAFWDKMDADKEEMQSLHDSIEEHKKAVLEKQQQANEIMKEIEDNQISVEDKVLKAIIDTREREIDELQKQRDAIEEASDNLINGLSEQLNKEKEMYSSQQNQDELSKLQRQLGILQRSGGSASQIANLQKEISQKQQDAYFDAQQKQIDALQEASDNELERLDNQIELMKETLEYEKENGLLWNQVYEVMAGTPEQITEFIMTHDSEFWGQSPTKDTQTYRETLFEAQQFKAYEGYMKDGFDALVKSFDDFAIAEAARDEEAKANATTSSGIDTGAASTPTTSSDNGGSSNPTNDSSTPTKSTVTDLTGAILAGLTSGAENVTKTSQQIQLKKTLVSGKGILRTYDSGGMIDQDQIALVHAKESVLTPEQTSILRNEILSNKPTSLLSLLTDFRDAYNSIPSASDYNTVNNNDGVTIEQAIVEMHVAKIANDYDAQRAGESALEKMVQIARKTQGQRIGR